MCTVTYIPVNGKIIITSNRDEKQWRSPALEPACYNFPSGKILFPRDSQAGGTWISLHESGHAVIFLNGGLARHEPRPPYKKSRGIILLQLADSANPARIFSEIALDGIEPFTAIIYQRESLYECVWNGSGKHIHQKDESSPHIWSSVTLYDGEAIGRRKKWFEDWITLNPALTQDQVIEFHRTAGDGDPYNDLVMKRSLSILSPTEL